MREEEEEEEEDNEAFNFAGYFSDYSFYYSVKGCVRELSLLQKDPFGNII